MIKLKTIFITAVAVMISSQAIARDQIKIVGSSTVYPYTTVVAERFFRTENAKKLKIEGTGLGLAITKHIINQHRGELKITSKFGKGSEFIVSLPKY